MMRQMQHYLWALCVTLFVTQGGLALLLSDLPTPSLVLEIHALQRQVNANAGVQDSSTPIPFLRINPNDYKLSPKSLSGASCPVVIDNNNAPDISLSQCNEAICYLHTRVIRARDYAISGQDDPVSTFLAEIDLPPFLCGTTSAKDVNGKPLAVAKLVLGLNNHHVGSYYWARSAGAGASMDVPGVVYDACHETRGVLRWETIGGPTECNSNDGKRSEWVNFLRLGDNVQLLPAYPQEAIIKFALEFGQTSDSIRVFGVSSKGRPLGSEPEVVCEWTISQ